LIGRNPSEQCFKIIKETVLTHQDAQMRSQALRCLPNYDAEKVVPILLEAAKGEKLDKMGEPEKKALFTAIGQTQAEETLGFLTKVFEQKSRLFGRHKVDGLKMLAILGFEAAPSVVSLQRLAEVAKDAKRHSKEVCDAAKAAVVQMQARLIGAVG
jgi:hypothetical protein